MKKAAMKNLLSNAEFQSALEGKEAELLQVLRTRDGIAIQKSADQMDEIQFATERDLAIGNVDRQTTLLRQVKTALLRIREDVFGICIDCDSPISPKRLTAVPWAARCIQCQEIADREGQQSEDSSEALVS
jgi:DnaK suppressor protein